MINKASHYRSFYDVARKIRDPMARLAFYEAIDAYRFDGVEPSDLPIEADIAFTAVRPNIDADSDRRENGAKGGRPKAKVSECENRGFSSAKPYGNMVLEEKNHTFPKSESNEDENENENENENVNVNVNVNTRERADTDAGASAHTLTLSEPQAKMAERVREVFERNALPCGDEISFLQGEFMRALRTLHSKYADYRLTSDDIVRACENYAAVVNDKGDYFDRRMPFDRLVEHDKFRDFLPSAFVKANWRRWGGAPAAAEGAEKQAESPPEKCPSCGRTRLVWSNAAGKYECGACGKSYAWEAINTWAGSPGGNDA